MNLNEMSAENRFALGQQLNTLLNKVLDNSGTQSMYHLDDKEFMIGRVISNKDPLKKRRIKVSITGVTDGIPNDDLSWAIPESQNSFGLSMIIPAEGDLVKVYFDNDDLNLPIYGSKITTMGDQFQTQEAFEDEEYPDVAIIIELENGGKITINRKTGEFDLDMANGGFISVSETGDISINAMNPNSNSKISIQCVGPMEINSDDKIEISGEKGIIFKTPEKIEFIAPGASLWIPNALPIDPLTGTPHGGEPSGILGLVGSEYIPDQDEI